MIQLPSIALRGIGPLCSHLYDKANRPELNFATENSPLVAVFETRWLVVSG